MSDVLAPDGTLRLVGGTPIAGQPRDVAAQWVMVVDSSGNPVSGGGGGGGGGDASAAKQDTGNASLASIDSKTPTLVSSRVPVVVGTALPAGTNNIGDVDVLTLPSLPAGTNTVGTVLAPQSAVVTTTLTTDTSAYAAGDVLVAGQAISNAARANDQTVVLNGITLIDEADQVFECSLFFMDVANSLGTANAAPSISDANAAAIQGRVRVTASDWVDLGGCKVAYVPCSIAMKPIASSRNIQVAALVDSGTPTFTSTSLKLRTAWLND